MDNDDVGAHAGGMTPFVIGAIVLLLVLLCVMGNRRRRGGAGTRQHGEWTSGHTDASIQAGVRGTNNTGSSHL